MLSRCIHQQKSGERNQEFLLCSISNVNGICQSGFPTSDWRESSEISCILWMKCLPDKKCSELKRQTLKLSQFLPHMPNTINICMMHVKDWIVAAVHGLHISTDKNVRCSMEKHLNQQSKTKNKIKIKLLTHERNPPIQCAS